MTKRSKEVRWWFNEMITATTVSMIVWVLFAVMAWVGGHR